MGDAPWSDLHKGFMRMACRLAARAAGRTSPNPLVGAVLARGKEVVGSGYHKRAGSDHAEIAALKSAGRRAKGATLYINLEPCSHYGRTPPCTGALIAAGIKEVVAGMRDPNPLVSGRGFEQLRRAGIRVRVGVLESECQALNEAFVKFITRRVPFVTLKLAASLDGKIAAVSGDARWISDLVSRTAVHRLRNRMDAVLVGAGTVLKDDPQLTCRISGGRNPWRVVLDGRLRIPVTARFLRQRDSDKNIVVTSDRAPEQKVRAFEAVGVRVWRFPARAGEIPWRAFLQRLAQSEIVSVLVEGGAGVASSALRQGAVDKVMFFYAAKIIGGDGRVMIDPLGINRVSHSLAVHGVQVEKSGGDVLVTGYIGKAK